MKRAYVGLLAAVLATGLAGSAWAERQLTADGAAPGEVESLMPAHEYSVAPDGYPALSASECGGQCGSGLGHWFGGVEYRYLRTSFSEAVAFATVTDSFPGVFDRRVVAEELGFDYNSSAKFYLGMRIGECQDLRFSYWNLYTDVNVNGVAGPGQTIVDPFGNLGEADASISTNASVNMNVYDLEYLQTMNFSSHDVDFVYSAGLRFVNVSQDYDSTIRDAADDVTSIGVFTADYGGVGPYFSLTGSTSRNRPFSLLAKGGAAILIGSYEVESGVTVPGVAVGGQTAQRIRAVPVMEAELGAAWHPTDCFTVSAGYLFQAWFNLGVSGGTFDGENLPLAPIDTVFGQTDDADIMSFDGLFVRAELSF